jgi:hypothetical protein
MNQCHLLTTDRRRRDEPIGIDSRLNSLIIHHALVLVGVFIWGVLAVSGLASSTVVSYTLNNSFYWVWALLHLFAPAVVWTGQVILHQSTIDRSKRDELVAWVFQLAGDLAIGLTVTTTMFCYAAAHDILVTLFMSGLAFSAALLAVRDAAKALKTWAAMCRGR